MSWPGRVRDVVSVVPDVHSTDVRSLLERLTNLSIRGLAEMYEPRSRSFPQTVRGRRAGMRVVAEGMSVRYTAVAALGLSRTSAPACREVLAGHELVDLLPGILGLALASRDTGATALSLWAALEVGSEGMPSAVRAQSERITRALDRLLASVRSDAPVAAVDHAWTLTALVCADRADELADVVGGSLGGRDAVAEAAERAARRLLDAQGAAGLFPHVLPAEHLNRFRSHVACFADQVYSLQALTRYAAATGDDRALVAAGRCAEHLAAVQGDEGQWWWHYDWRGGRVVERYPVYSVHQHAMAPMALLELREAGGPDHRRAVARGLGWLLERPESSDDLIAEDLGVVWRKVGRADPRKMVRTARSVASARRPSARLGWLDHVFPPGSIDRECRPFELGWLLYAWHAGAPSRPVDADLPELLGLPEPVEAAGERS